MAKRDRDLPANWDLYHRINGSPVRARLNKSQDYILEPNPTYGHPVMCRNGEWDVREGECGTGWRHAVSPEVFREFYTRIAS